MSPAGEAATPAPDPDESTPSRTTRGGPGSMVPPAEVRTYYDRPVIKRPVWTWEIPSYFFLGGLSGAAAVVAGVADIGGRPALARAARRAAAGALLPSPALLVSDLGRPSRFHHMLRVVKPTSPMSVGAWLLAVYGPPVVGAALLGEIDRLPRLRRTASVVAGALGPGMSTYTAVLFADTAVPVWHEARRTLPGLFAASSAASAGAATYLLAGDADGDGARRLMIGGSLAELAADRVMHRELGDLGRPYGEGTPGRWSRAATALVAAGAVLALAGRRRRAVGALGALCTLAGSLATRWAVFAAGTASAEDPRYTVEPQRARANRATS